MKTNERIERFIRNTVSLSTMEGLKWENKIARMKNPKMLSQLKTMRKMGVIPTKTYYFLKKLDPTLVNDTKKLNELFAKYKEFSATDGDPFTLK